MFTHRGLNRPHKSPTRSRATVAGHSIPSLFRVALLLHLAFSAVALGQETTTRPSPSQSEEIIRVEANLMQAGVTVLDKQGRFVDGLKAEQFELLVDGKPQTLSFFDRVAAGGPEERAKLARAARGAKPPAAADTNAQPGSLLQDQGRVVIFFLDDLHMQPDSMARARKAIQHFLDKEMGQNDMVAVASASGQLGFLQQLTGNKSVLRAASSRLKPLSQGVGDGQLPVMTEYLAKAIIVEGDRDVLETYIQALLRDNIKRNMAEAMVRERARVLLQMASATTRNTLRSLNSLVRTVAPLSGRKLVFFFSNGFLLNRQDSDVTAMLREITDAAVRAGFVLYTLDAGGLAPDTWLDAAAPLPADFASAGSVVLASRGEMSASQEALHLLAEQTGGRAILHTNNLTNPLSRAVNETAAYYVLAWQPTEGEQKGGRFRRLEVSVKGRPDLVVLVQRGFLEASDVGATRRETGGKDKKVRTGDELTAALSAAIPLRDIPTHLYLSYSSPQKADAVMTALLSVPLNALGPAGGAVEVEGYVVNLEGKIGSRFKERLNVGEARAPQAQGTGRHALYRFQVKLAPGTYQVRAAARDTASGRVGSAAEWIEIPDLKSGQFTLGSLITGERPQQTGESYNEENFVSRRNAEQRFTRDSHLRFMTYIYNAARGPQGGPPELEAQIQVLRADKPVHTYEPLKVDITGSDFGRIAYGGEVGLDTFSPGKYVLQITIKDRHAQVSTSQRAAFIVD